jgi:CheY-like chemotaxis protein
MGMEALPAGEGLLLSPAPAIHTAFMRFPIDALFLDRDLRVLDVRERLRPWRVASKPKARAVLELSAGECARKGVRVGDHLGLRERKPTDADQADSAEPPATLATSESIIWPASLGQLGELGGRQAMRVLVISRDRHFRSVTSMLLSHRGCSVSATAKASRVTELINRDRGADVVVIDAGQSPTSVQAIAEAAAFAQSIGVVLVDDVPSESQRPPVLAKWGPFEQLFAAIEQAAQYPGDERCNGTGG